MYWRVLGSGGEWKKEPDSIWDDDDYRLACMGRIEFGSEEYIREEAMSNKVEAATHGPEREWRFMDNDYRWTKWMSQDHVTTPGMGAIDIRLSPDGDFLEVQSSTMMWRPGPFTPGTFEIRAKEEFRVVTICGSMRFKDVMLAEAEALSRLGYIVLMPFCVFSPSEQLNDETKKMLDRMHFSKIDMSHEIFVVNPGGYVGNSTYNEIRHAQETGKPVSSIDELPPALR